MSIRSMTGFARARNMTPHGEIILSLKTVNHRGLDIHFHIPSELVAFEGILRNRVRSSVHRGHVQVHVNVAKNSGTASVGINRPLLDAYLDAFRQAADEYGLRGTPDLNDVLRVPGMFGEAQDHAEAEDLEAPLLAAIDDALLSLNEFREREGSEIAAEIHTRNAQVAALTARMEDVRSRALPAFQERLSTRLKELLDGVAIDPQRLAQEVAVLADRSDIGEELTRLKIHSAQLDGLLQQGGEVGKKMDFLLQEMNRETNTVLSKTGGVGEIGLTLTELGLAAKSEIDKLREHALNLE